MIAASFFLVSACAGVETLHKLALQEEHPAARSEGEQNMLCAYLAALLIGLGTNALLGWWWADPLGCAWSPGWP